MTPSQNAIEQVRQKSQDEFIGKRVRALSATFFPEDAIPAEFMPMLHRLLKFNSRKQMGVHPKTWENMCNKTREFFLPEIEVCFEILERATPNELVKDFGVIEPSGTDIFGSSFLKTDSEILKEYNEVEYPKVLAILAPMRDMYNKIDKAISVPLANKINADAKLSLQIPIGTQINFVALPNHG